MLKKKGVRVTITPHENGYLNPRSIEEAITTKTRLIAATHMPNILGTVQPVWKRSAALPMMPGCLSLLTEHNRLAISG